MGWCWELRYALTIGLSRHSYCTGPANTHELAQTRSFCCGYAALFFPVRSFQVAQRRPISAWALEQTRQPARNVAPARRFSYPLL